MRSRQECRTKRRGQGIENDKTKRKRWTVRREQKRTCVGQRKINKIYVHARAAQARIDFLSKCEFGVRFGWVRENVNVNDVDTNESSGRAAAVSSSRRPK